MHLGEPTWSFKINCSLKLDDLTQISFPRNEYQEKFIENELYEDIKLNGLKKALEIEWLIGEIDELRIFKGNQRIQVLRRLNYKEAPCILTIEGYKETENIGKILRKIL